MGYNKSIENPNGTCKSYDEIKNLLMWFEFTTYYLSQTPDLRNI